MNGLSVLLALLTSGADIATELKTLQNDYKEAQAAFNKELGEIKDRKLMMDFYHKKNPVLKFYPKARDLAGRAKGDSSEFEVALFVYPLMHQNAQMAQPATPKDYEKAGEELASFAKGVLANHATHDRIGEFSELLGYPMKDAETRSILEGLLSKNQGKPAEPTLMQQLADNYKGWGQPAPEDEARALGLYEDLTKRFPDHAATKRAAGNIYEIKNLSVGKSFPDFETIDEKDVKWKLSDYKGKVVVLDFWGFW